MKVRHIKRHTVPQWARQAASAYILRQYRAKGWKLSRGRLLALHFREYWK